LLNGTVLSNLLGELAEAIPGVQAVDSTIAVERCRVSNNHGRESYRPPRAEPTNRRPTVMVLVNVGNNHWVLLVQDGEDQVVLYQSVAQV
jgi:hypothetical protein